MLIGYVLMGHRRNGWPLPPVLCEKGVDKGVRCEGCFEGSI